MPLSGQNDKQGRYDTAQICFNGHIINTRAETEPEYNKGHCTGCGAVTITSCPKCGAKILGQLHPSPKYLALPVLGPPKFCWNCGMPYPWTEARLKAAHDLANEIEQISASERKILTDSLDELVKESPQTEVAAIRVKKMMRKAGTEAAHALREVLVDIISEAARKAIFGR